MATLKLTKSPHVLFRGTDGSITAGIHVERTDPKDEVEDRGYSRDYPVNTFSLVSHPGHYVEALGLTISDVLTLIEECRTLEGTTP